MHMYQYLFGTPYLLLKMTTFKTQWAELMYINFAYIDLVYWFMFSSISSVTVGHQLQLMKIWLTHFHHLRIQLPEKKIMPTLTETDNKSACIIGSS